MKRIIKGGAGKFLLAALLMAGLFSACKKDKPAGEDPAPPPPTGGVSELSDADSLKYLMYRIMQTSFVDGGRDSTYDLPFYYWYKQVPKLNPLSADFSSASTLLTQMKTYAKDPATGRAVDKYSFLDDGTVSDEIQGGVSGDLGMEVTFAYDAEDNIILVVLYADKNSPAGSAGVDRGFQITNINGSAVVYDGNNGPGVKKVIDAIYNDNQATFTFKRLDGTSFTKQLSKAQYAINPVLFDTVYTVSGKKTGYFVFNTFSNVSNNGTATTTKHEIDRVFKKFEAANISSLIVDLRYNGGGSVNTAEYLDSLIAPPTANGKVMYTYLYNDKISREIRNIGLDEKVLFNGTGNLRLDDVFFIGTGSTASASELTMNNLKPYMNVHLVGDTTYGKPVGFFSFNISVFDKNHKEKSLADLYAINFETRNAANEGAYFNGIVPDALAPDYVGYPWGHPSDANLTSIFKYISSGSFARISTTERMKQDRTLKIPIEGTHKSLRFNGMVDYKMGKVIKNEMERRLNRVARP